MNTIHHTEAAIEPTADDRRHARPSRSRRRRTPTGTHLACRRRFGRGRLPRSRSCSRSASSAAPPSTSSPARPCSPSPAAGRCSPCCRLASPANLNAGHACPPSSWPSPGWSLLIAQPDDRALNTAGWVWPPLLLALAVWMVVQLRRNLGGRVRWLLYPVVASLALGSVGGMYETAVTAHDQHAYPAPGTLYDVGGHRLHLSLHRDRAAPPSCSRTGSERRRPTGLASPPT